MRSIGQTPRTVLRSPSTWRSPGILLLLGIATGMAGLQTAVAHHSFAQRMAGELQSIEIHEGTIGLYKMLNPHSALIVRVDGDGNSGEDAAGEDWLIELSSASTLGREGWTDDFLSAGDRVSIAILASRTPNRGRLRALLVHADAAAGASRLIVAYGIRGDTLIMRRLRERLPTCAGIEARLERGECFMVEPAALRALQEEFPGEMGYILP